MLGPGKYDDECTQLREKTEAAAVILMVVNGREGSGFSCQAPFEITLRLPALLREVADSIEGDISTNHDLK